MTAIKRNEISMANQEQYRAVLDDLQKQRNELQFRVGEIDSAIVALRRLMPPEVRTASMEQARISGEASAAPQSSKYAGMGVRWSILSLLTEEAHAAMTTGAIAEALSSGGVQSTSKNFAGNVSAVLSEMNHKRGEVSSSADGWVISEKGKSAWIHIKASRDKQAGITEDSLSILQ